MHGVLVVAKPAGPTSHDVVALVRRLASTRRIGHGGTLDPFASGVLPLFLGGATRLVEYHLADDKAYRATICFGATSTTDDLDGELTPRRRAPAPDARGASRRARRRSSGRSCSSRPSYSAIQVGGRRAYAMARAGEAVDLPPRSVEHPGAGPRSSGTRRTRSGPIAIVDVRCSAGTYVRALARDLGARLGCGAYLGALVRTASGPFTLADARSLDDIRDAAAATGPDGVRALLLPSDTGLDALPAVALTARRDRRCPPGPLRPARRAGFAVRTEDVPLRLVDAAGADRGHGPARRRAGSPRRRCCPQ